MPSSWLRPISHRHLERSRPTLFLCGLIPRNGRPPHPIVIRTEQADAFPFTFAPANVSACGDRNLSSLSPFVERTAASPDDQPVTLPFAALPGLRGLWADRARHLPRHGRGLEFPSIHSNHSSLATIPFRITSFADPYPLTLIESNSYKKHGGYPPSPFATRHSSDTPQLQQVIDFH